MIKKQSSVQFELEGLGEQQKPKITPQNTDDNHFREAEVTEDESSELVIRLQKTLKSEYLILNNQQKRKADNIKLIECAARKAIEKWIHTQCLIEEGPIDNKLLLNEKDLQDIQPNLPIDIDKMIGQLLNKNQLLGLFTMISKEAPSCVIQDLSNFNPQYLSLLTTLLLQQISVSPKLDSICESKTNLISKFLDNIYRRYECELFSQRVLERGLQKMCEIRSELNIDFGREYERIKEAITETKFARMFAYGEVTEGEVREVVRELEGVLGIDGAGMSDIVHQIRVTEMDDNNRRSLINQFKTSLECEEDYVNFKIGMLTLKSIRQSRRMIEEVSVIFAEDILDSIDAFPDQIRHLIAVYSSAASKKFPEFKPDDSINFLIKTVFSKWIFTDLMRNYCSRSSLSVQAKNVNFSTVCLVLQKILYGQQFYEKETYAYFNKLIAHYSEKVAEFMNNFGKKMEVKRDANRVDVVVWSLETVRFVVKSLKDNIAMFGDYQGYHYIEPILSRPHYQMGNLKYPPNKLYVLYIEVRTGVLSKLFNPKQKLRKILIQFLLSIPQLTQPVSLSTLLDRHKYGSQTSLNSKVSVQLYANYLISLRGSLDLQPTVESIYLQLRQVKRQQKINRVLLETTKGYFDSLEKVFMALAEERIAVRLNQMIEGVFGELQMRWRMIVRQGQPIQVETTKETEFGNSDGDGEAKVSIYESDSVKEFLENIVMIYNPSKNTTDKEINMNINKVYNQFIEELLEASSNLILSKNQKIDPMFYKYLKDKVGVMLWNQIKLKNILTEEDRQVSAQIDRLSFISMRHLQQKFTLQQPLFAELTIPLRQTLTQPCSPQSLIKHFYNLIISFQQVILSTGKAADVTAQVQLPLMQFLILKSRIPNLASIMRFIDTFYMQETMNTVLGQTMTVILSSLVLLKDMNGERLGISEQEFQRLTGGKRVTKQEQGRLVDGNGKVPVVGEVGISNEELGKLVEERKEPEGQQ